MDIEFIRHFQFHDFNEKTSRSLTAYRIFLNEKLREGFNKGLDPKKVKNNANNTWNRMTKEEKEVYFKKKKENDNWILKAQKINKVNAIAVFIQRKMEESKENHMPPPELKDIAPAWKKLTEKEKISYREYAEEINEEKEKLKDIHDLIIGIKPKKPKGAFLVFLKEKAKKNKLNQFLKVKIYGKNFLQMKKMNIWLNLIDFFWLTNTRR